MIASRSRVLDVAKLQARVDTLEGTVAFLRDHVEAFRAGAYRWTRPVERQPSPAPAADLPGPPC
jgi:hypothetical protein